AVWRIHDLKRRCLAHLADFPRTVLAPDESFDRVDSVGCIRDCLAFGNLTHEPFAFFGETDDGGRCASTFLIRDNLNRAAFEHGDATVGRPQIYANRLSH